MPATLAGYNVLHVTTPDNTACAVHPIIILQAPQQSAEGFLGNVSPQSVLEMARAIEGAPEGTLVSYVGPTVTREDILENIARWNAGLEGQECEPLGGSEIE